MKSSVFITGGGGFIAPHLIRALGEQDIFVHLRRQSSRVPGDLPSNCNVLREDLTDSTLIAKLSGGVDTVFHLAGAINASSAFDLVDANVVSTANVINLMAQLRTPHLVFMSTAAVWGGKTGERIEENTPPTPNTPYGFAKLAAEALIADAVVRGSIASATILRCNNTYGPGSRQGVVANFFQLVCSGKAIQIDGDGMQLREPLYISDLVDLLILAMAKPSGLQVYGVSGPHAMTVSEIARAVAEVSDCELKIDWCVERSDRSRHLLISNSAVESGLAWRPKISLFKGLRELMSYDSSK
jgi:UDP-glucose 4-epimerase